MRSLGRQLEMFFGGVVDRTDPATAALLRRRHLAQSDAALAGQARAAGEVAPDFTLPDQNGDLVTLSDRLARGPVVLLFFRGGWCPFCSITLRAYDEIEPMAARAGGTMLAVGPQTVDGMRAMAEAQGLTFPLLSDHGNAVARRYGLACPLDAEAQAMYRRLGHDLPAINGVPGWELPTPASYVIAPDGVIRLARADARVTHRLEPAEVLAALQDIQAPAAA